MSNIVVFILLNKIFMGYSVHTLADVDAEIENNYKLTSSFFAGLDSSMGSDEQYILRKTYFYFINDDLNSANGEFNKIPLPLEDSYYLMCKALLASPDSVEIWFKKAEAVANSKLNYWLFYEMSKFYEQDNLALFANYLEKSLEIKSDFTPALLLKASLLDPGYDCDSIIELLKPVVVKSNSKEGYNFLANAYFSCGLYQKSKELFAKSVEVWKINPDGFYGLGFLAEEYDKDSDKAVAYYKTSILQDSSNYQVYVDLAWLYFDKGDYKNAQDVFEQVKKVSGNSQEVINQMVMFYCYRSDFYSAKKLNDYSYNINKREIDFDENRIVVRFFEVGKNPSHVMVELEDFYEKYGKEDGVKLMEMLMNVK